MNEFSLIRLTVRRIAAYRGSFFAFFVVLAIAVGATFVIQEVSSYDATRVIRSSQELRSSQAFLELSTRESDSAGALESNARGVLEPLESLDAVTVSRSTRSGGSDSDFAVWTIGVVPEKLTSTELELLIARVPSVLSGMKAQEISPRGLTTAGELEALARIVDTRVAHLAGVSFAAQAVVGAVALVTVLWFASAIVKARSRELILLLARGHSVRVSTAEAFFQGSAVGLLAGFVAVLCGVGVLFLLGIPVSASLNLWMLAVGLILGTSMLAGSALASFEFIAARAATTVGRTASGAKTPKSFVVLIGAGVVTTFALWRLVAAGNAPDVLAVVSPALLLIGLTLIALNILPAVFASIARVRGRKSVAEFLGLTRLSRDFSAFTLPLSLTILASAVIVFAAGYAGQTSSSQLRELSLSNGSDLQLRVNDYGPLLPTEQFTGATLMDAARSGGQENARAQFIVQVPANVGSLDSAVLATNWRQEDAIYGAASQLQQLGHGGTVLAPAADGRNVMLTVQTSGDALNVKPMVILMDSQGALASISDFEVQSTQSTGTEYSATLPRGVGDWSVVGVVLEGSLTSTNDGASDETGEQTGEFVFDPDAEVEPSQDHTQLVGGYLSVDGQPQHDLSQFLIAERGSTTELVTVEKSGAPVTVRANTKTVLLPPTTQYPVQTVATNAVFETLGDTALSSEQPLEVRVGGATIPTRMTGVTDDLPGYTQTGIAVDSLSLAQAQLLHGAMPSRATEIWVRTDSSQSLTVDRLEKAHERATQLLSTLEQNNVTDANGGPITTDARIIAKALPPSATTIFTIAALSVIALSALGVTAALNAINRSRRWEVRALRGLGLTREQQAMRRIELTYVFTAALIIGTLIGIVATVATSTFFGAPHITWVPLDTRTLGWGSILLLGAIAAAWIHYERSIKRAVEDYDARAHS